MSCVAQGFSTLAPSALDAHFQPRRPQVRPRPLTPFFYRLQWSLRGMLPLQPQLHTSQTGKGSLAAAVDRITWQGPKERCLEAEGWWLARSIEAHTQQKHCCKGPSLYQRLNWNIRGSLRGNPRYRKCFRIRIGIMREPLPVHRVTLSSQRRANGVAPTSTPTLCTTKHEDLS